jgi:hypothetical protein
LDDNIWYLPNNIDIRSCPKNGMSSIKSFYYKAQRLASKEDHVKLHREFSSIKGGPSNFREARAWDLADMYDYPFRKNSIRFAVKRDPVERFKSAVEYLQNRKSFETKCARDYKKPYDNISDLLDDLENQRVFEIHLLPQSHFMEVTSRYTFIYDITELSSMFKHISLSLGLKWSSGLNPYNNISANTSTEELETIQKRFSTDKKNINNLSKIRREKITDDLTEIDIQRIKSLYKIDYDNGWC